ncbi:MAG: GNAT family N-acetyltransferase [Chromatiales bacterium]|nr:GNAT family N-acetyltransferase [Chromatiales bacterium]
MGVARYAHAARTSETCEFAIVVADKWQNRGIGTRLLALLMEAARAKGFKTMEGEVLTENVPMLNLVRRLGFNLWQEPDSPTIFAVSRTP